MDYISFFHEFDGEKLAIRHYEASSDRVVFLLHGAGESSQERLLTIAKFCQKYNYNVISFDYSGHGESSNFLPSSISKKTSQAIWIFENFVQKFSEIHIFAFSMSGQITINLLEKHQNIASISFFSTALYSTEFFSIPFGSDFKQALSQVWNWNQSNISQILPYFKGKVFLIRPDFDPVIPIEVSEMYKKFANPDNFSEIIIPGAPHTLGKFFQENPSEFIVIFEKIFKK